jgi:hypothetical protein
MKKPEFYKQPPQKEIFTRTKVKETQISDGFEVDIQKLDPSNTLELDVRYSRWEDEYFLVEYSTTVTPNEKYEIELAEYNKEKEKYESDLVKYNNLLEQDRVERAKREKEARRQKYEELRKEFESR